MSSPRKIGAAILATAVFMAISCSSLIGSAEIPKNARVLYVSPQGDDGWTGALKKPNQDGTDGPVRSLQGARDAVRRLRKKDAADAAPIVVLFREGVYRQSEAVTFTSEDSGTSKTSITYRAEPGAEVALSGGRPLSGWRQEGDVWKMEIPDVRDGKWNFTNLWVNGRRAMPARTPNKGAYFYTAGHAPKPEGAPENWDNRAFRFEKGDLEKWDDLAGATLIAFHSWTASIMRIKSVDFDKQVIELTGPMRYPAERWGPRQRFIIEGILEAVDQPGEWHLDRDKGVVTYMPREGEDPSKATTRAAVAEQLLILDGKPEDGEFLRNLHFQDLSFQYTDFPIPDEGLSMPQAAVDVSSTIQATGALGCSFENCEVVRTGGYAIWFGAGSSDNRVEHCELHDLGAGGVRLADKDTPREGRRASMRNVVDNNFIHHGGRVFREAVGVWIGRGSYNKVTHNEICDFYYTGVSVGWLWGYTTPSTAHHNEVGWNHIHHLGQGVLSDMGGIYTLGVSPGLHLHHNRIHNVISYAYGGWGIYPDEGTSQMLAEYNIVYDTKTGGFHQHYGEDNIIRNNIFAYAIEGQIQRSRQEDHMSFYFERNIVVNDNGQALSGNWSNNQYRMDYNCYWDAGGPELKFKSDTFEQWRAKGHDLHSIYADPKFVNAAERDFRLKSDSPAFDLGFKEIDLGKVGLYGDSNWVAKPRKIEHDRVIPYKDLSLGAFEDDFEKTPVGSRPRYATCFGNGENSDLSVTDEVSAGGERSLHFGDAPNLEKAYEPFCYYRPGLNKGRAVANFDVRVGPKARFWHEWRDNSNPYRVGPSVRVEEGKVTVGGRELMNFPADEWVHMKIGAPLGADSSGQYGLSVTLPDGEVKTFQELKFGSPDFQQLDWFGFVSLAEAKTDFWIDNVKLEVNE